MLSEDSLVNIDYFLETISQKYHLDHAYFARKIGKRRHFLVGYGNEQFIENNHFDITDNIVFFWQTRADLFDVQIIRDSLLNIARQLEQELN